MKEITVATYNICHGHYADYDWRAIASVIQKAGADLVGFQEIDMHTVRTGGMDTIAELIQATGFSHAKFIPAMNYDGGQYGTAILSRYPISVSEVHPLPSGHYEPRSFGRATIALSAGQQLSFLNTHLSVESRDQQNIQFSYIADWMEKNLSPHNPIVLTGDFNTEDFSAFTPLMNIGLSLVNCKQHEYKTFRNSPVAIDNIVYGHVGLTPIAHGIIDSECSDHNLLWCRFSIQ